VKRMATAAPWKEPLQRALKKNAGSRDSRYVQLATVRPDGRPANRTVVYRGFLADSNVLTFVTDTRWEALSGGSWLLPWVRFCRCRHGPSLACASLPDASQPHARRSPAAHRSRKIGEIAHNPWAEVAWYFPNTREQFRVLGKLTIVDSQTDDAALQKVRSRTMAARAAAAWLLERCTARGCS
jgi:hypothetical protein